MKNNRNTKTEKYKALNIKMVILIIWKFILLKILPSIIRVHSNLYDCILDFFWRVRLAIKKKRRAKARLLCTHKQMDSQTEQSYTERSYIAAVAASIATTKTENKNSPLHLSIVSSSAICFLVCLIDIKLKKSF